MSLSQTQIDEAIAAFGLPPLAPVLVSTLESINGGLEADFLSGSNVLSEGQELQGQEDIAELPQVQTEVVPVLQMFDAAFGYMPLQPTLSSMVSSNLTETSLASALVSSQTFANLYNEGVALDPNAPASDDLIEALFIRDLGHAPSVATLAGFDGLSNAQAFLEIATSDAVSNALGPYVQADIRDVVALTTGVISGDPGQDSVTIVGQSSPTHAGGAQIVHGT
jgi:hypothetical protein